MTLPERYRVSTGVTITFLLRLSTISLPSFFRSSHSLANVLLTFQDPEKKRYFKVEKSQTAPPTAQWSSSSVKRREHESQVAEQAAKRQQLTKNHVKRSVLTRDAVASGLLARETEIDRTAEAGRGKRENGDVLAAAWAREVTAKGKISFGMSWELSGHPHMSCFYIVGKESGSKSAIAYSGKHAPPPFFLSSLLLVLHGIRRC